jgi:putative zinc finger protein
MTCERVRAQLTSYLDGELDGDAGTVVRGHLRTCEACRTTAADEAVLRDGLRSMPSVDPPASMWAGVQARLAAEEVAESKRPAWRRALARWQRWIPAPRVAMGGVLVAAAAVGVIVWKTHETPEPVQLVDTPVVVPPQTFAAETPKPPARPNCTQVADAPDVTEDLQLDGKRMLTAYDCAIDELLGEAANIRGEWTDTQRAAFDDKVKAMRETLAKADGKPKQRAARAMVTYLQGAVTRDQVLLAGVP